MIKRNSRFILLLLGLFFRIAISFYTYSGDVTNHMIWGETAVKNGLQGLYDIDFYKYYGHISPNYPPITILFFAFLYLVKVWVYQFAWFLNLHLPFFPSKLIFFLKDFDYYPYLLKLPAILSDIGIAYVSYLFAKKIVGKKKSAWPVITSSLVLFNPAYFYNSAYWGQIDSIPLFFLLTSFYYLLYHKKFLTSAILITLGLLSKQTVIIFIPLFLLILSTKVSLKRLIIICLISLTFFWVFFLPFYQQGHLLIFPFLTFWNKILLVSGLPFTSNHAFNFWYLLTGSRTTLASSKFILDISYDIWGYLIAGTVTFLVLLKLIKNKFKSRDILYVGFLIPFITFLFLTKMHERHLILVLPFLLLASHNNKFLLISFFYLSLFNFLNLYHSWWAPPIFILQQLFSSPFITKSATVLLLIFFIVISINYFGVSLFTLKKK